MAGQEGFGASLLLLAKPGSTALFLSVIQVIYEERNQQSYLQAALLNKPSHLLVFRVMCRIKYANMERSVAVGSVMPWTP